MEIRVEQIDGRYVAHCPFEQKDIVKAAGFRWDRDRRHWYTTDPETAAKLGSADKLAEKIAAQREVKQAAIAMSRASDADVELPVPDGLAYLPYQRAGIAYAIGREATLLGDDMGLGKTIQGVGIISADPTIKRVLVICPATLKLNWARELAKWLVRPLTIEIAAKYFPSSDVVIINYDILKKHHERMLAVEWDLVICDEAHYMKNPKAQRTICVVGKDKRRDEPAVPGIRARRRICLTGTPIPNRPVEAWPIIHWLDPVNFGNFFSFAKRYCNGHQGSHGWDFSGASNLEELQDKLRSTIMIRRLKGDVLTELPAKRRSVVELEMDAGMRAAVETESRTWAQFEDEVEGARVEVELAKAEDDDTYADAVGRLRALTQSAFTELSKVRHDTAVRKIPLVVEHIRDIIEQDIKVVCFAHHKDVIDGILSEFPGAVSITGSTPMLTRQQAVDRFQTDPDCLLFVGNIQAAGVGITLTAAANVVFAELDWVPGNVTQAEDRCHRIGQRDTVFVQHLVLDGSLDAKIAKTLIVKQEIIDRALDRVKVAGEIPPAIPSTKREAGSTESTTRDALSEMADAITAEQVSMIHHCLMLLAGICDGARTQDGAGFNAMDTAIGKSLAARGNLSKRQAALGLKIITKYRRQLPADLLAGAKGQ